MEQWQWHKSIVLTNGVLTTATGIAVTNRDGFIPPFFDAAGVSRTLTSVVPPLLLGRRLNNERAQFSRASDETVNGQSCYRLVSESARLSLIIDKKTMEIVRTRLAGQEATTYEIHP